MSRRNPGGPQSTQRLLRTSFAAHPLKTYVLNHVLAMVIQVTKGMDIIDRLYSGYGEGAPSGKGPNQMKLQSRGNEYLAESFPKLSYINSAKLL